MKYRTQSANVLNEADRYERILDWQLFCMEQEKVLYWTTEESDWVPGEPLFDDPRTYSTWSRRLYGDNENLEGHYGNHVRPMFEVFEDHSRNNHRGCADCQVGWGRYEEQICWMCGKDYSHLFRKLERPESLRSEPNLRFYGFDANTRWQGLTSIPLDQSDNATEFVENLLLQREITYGLQAEMGRGFGELLRSMFDDMRAGIQRQMEVYRGLSARFALFDQAWTTPISSRTLTYNLGPVAPYVPPVVVNPFERTDLEVSLPSLNDGVAEPLEWRALTHCIDMPDEIPTRSVPTPTPPPRRDLGTFEEPVYVALTRPSRR